MDLDFRILSRQLAPMMNKMQDVKDDKNVTKAKHNGTNEKVDETKIYTPH